MELNQTQRPQSLQKGSSWFSEDTAKDVTEAIEKLECKKVIFNWEKMKQNSFMKNNPNNQQSHWRNL